MNKTRFEKRYRKKSRMKWSCRLVKMDRRKPGVCLAAENLALTPLKVKSTVNSHWCCSRIRCGIAFFNSERRRSSDKRPAEICSRRERMSWFRVLSELINDPRLSISRFRASMPAMASCNSDKTWPPVASGMFMMPFVFRR